MLFKAFCFALTFLTRIPVPDQWLLPRGESSPGEFRSHESTVGKSTVGEIQDQFAACRALSTQFYASVGAVIGIVLVTSALFLNAISSSVSPASISFCLLAVWVGLSGALHLDGLADCTDAAGVAHRSPHDILRVMQEPTVGAMAVVVLVVLLLGKFVFLQELLLQGNGFALILLLAISRLCAVIYMRVTPYVGNGLASDLIHPKHDVLTLLQATFLLICIGIMFGFTTMLLLFIVLSVALWWWRAKWLRLVGGYTGDCVGAFIELAELAMLIVFCL